MNSHRPLALLVLALAASSFACSAADDSKSPANASGTDQQASLASNCDRSPYNCSVPNDEALPAGTARDTNRAYDSYDQSYFWPLLDTPELRDGENGLRGYVAGGGGGNDHATKLDFGERKMLGGVEHVYAFSVLLTNGNSASGWIPSSSIKRQATLAKMPTVEPKDPGTPYYEEDWVVTGGDLKSDHDTFALNDQYGDLRVNPDITDGEHASDYLVRQWDPSARTGYVNLLFALPHSGGVTDDTLPVCVHFKRFQGVDELDSTLWFPGSSQESSLKLHFVYGTVGGRRGWMTHEMLTESGDVSKLDAKHPCRAGSAPSAPAPIAPAPTQTSTPTPPAPTSTSTPTPVPTPAPASFACHVLCCQSGAGTNDFTVASDAACITQAQNACDSYGHVQSATSNGSSVYDRDGSTTDLRCFAKCKSRTDYHEVVGVTEDCDGKAADYCGESDRGGLVDAMWDRCDPS